MPRLGFPSRPRIGIRAESPVQRSFRRADPMFPIKYPAEYKAEQDHKMDMAMRAAYAYEASQRRREENYDRLRALDFNDSTLTCDTCGCSFPFSAGEQAFYQEKGLHPPKRCPDHRGAKKDPAGTNGRIHSSNFTDISLTCRDCGNAFVFTAGEQDFYAQKGFTNHPHRCPDCRVKRKQRP